MAGAVRSMRVEPRVWASWTAVGCGTGGTPGTSIELTNDGDHDLSALRPPRTKHTTDAHACVRAEDEPLCILLESTRVSEVHYSAPPSWPHLTAPDHP